MPGPVIEHRFDNVRLHAKIGHAGGTGSAQIVHPPVPQRRAGFGNALI
jgi:hypothetical protein